MLYELAEEGHREQALDRDRSMTYLECESSYRRADSVHGRVLVLTNPTLLQGWKVIENMHSTEIGARVTFRATRSAYGRAVEEEKEEEIQRRTSACSRNPPCQPPRGFHALAIAGFVAPEPGAYTRPFSGLTWALFAGHVG